MAASSADGSPGFDQGLEKKLGKMIFFFRHRRPILRQFQEISQFIANSGIPSNQPFFERNQAILAAERQKGIILKIKAS
jgi:hypothetical protein